MSGGDAPSSGSDTAVGLPPTVRSKLSEILSYAASQERTVVEFRTTETGDGSRHLSHALDVTEFVEELEANADEVPEK